MIETKRSIISEFSKLAQKKCETRHDWVGKVFDWELWNKSKFDHRKKLYMHNPEYFPGNETSKLL